MSVHYFEGPAGTGKTFKLIESLKDVLKENRLSDGQFILALTFMHGSRKRLSEKLFEVQDFKRKFKCLTIDSFAYSLVRRFRDLLLEKGINVNDIGIDFNGICNACGEILHLRPVVEWVATVYPIIIADEFQDCSPERVYIFDGLKEKCKILAAADEFQDLNCLNSATAIGWLRSNGKGECLSVNHRTNKNGILNACNYIRNGKPPMCGNFRDGFFLGYGYKQDIANSITAKGLQWNRWSDAAILCPTSINTSRCFQQLVDALKNKVRVKITDRATGGKKDAFYGPFFPLVEQNNLSIRDEICANIGLDIKHLDAIVCSTTLKLEENRRGIPELRNWIRKQQCLKGKNHFTSSEILCQIDRIIQYTSAFCINPPKGLSAMTIHQAKNREFNNVIVLWPYDVVQDKEKQKRLLYNGISRAKDYCTLIVMGSPKKNRIESIFS